MGRMTTEKKFQKIIDDSMTVEELISHLQKIPKDTICGRVGHFGEFHAIDAGFDPFNFREAYITPDGWWRNETRKKIMVIDFDVIPDIGPEPD